MAPRHRRFRWTLPLLLFAGLAGWSPPAVAVDIEWTGAVSLDWNVGGNWFGDLVPEGNPFEEVAIINNGDNAFLNSVPAFPAGGMVLGQPEIGDGGLEIQSGGYLELIKFASTPGTAVVGQGQGGVGSLAVRPGGGLKSVGLTVNGVSSLVVGGPGAGAADINVSGVSNLFGSTRVIGAGHQFVTSTLGLFNNSSLTAEINSASHSPISAFQANLAGTLVVEFDGYTPAIGDSWPLIDAAIVQGSFANVDLSMAPPTSGPGVVYQLANRPQPGGTNQVTLELNRVLQLSVNADSGAVSMSSPSGVPIEIDGYSILSDANQLSSAGWQSLQDQSQAGWFESNAAAGNLSELNADIGGGLSVNSPVGLGSPFQLPAFGETPEVAFEYTTPSGEVFAGLVEFTGNSAVNNLLLTVDPVTGEAQLKNASQTPLDIDGYSILSNSGSLLPDNGDWMSREDAGQSGVVEANADPQALSELVPEGFVTLAPGQSWDLGAPFDAVAGSQDLQIEFFLDGAPDPLNGVVAYGAIVDPGVLLGDYNNDGIVNAADYTVWRDSDGQSITLPNEGASPGVVDAADYNLWESQYGAATASASGAEAAPEPAGISVLLIAAGASAAARRRRLTPTPQTGQTRR